MTRLARQFVNFTAVLAVALLIGTGIRAQENAAAKPKPAPKAQKAKAEMPSMSATAAAQQATKKRSKTVAKAHRKVGKRHAKVAEKKPEKTAAPAQVAAANPAATAPAPAPAETSVDLVGKRDPFVALVNTSKGGAEHLPPGKAGLVIGTLTVQGTVQGGNGMIAVIANPDQRVYFVREGDRLYDGDVEKISLDGVTFQQNTKDAFGKPIERTVVKRIYPSAGEQQ